MRRFFRGVGMAVSFARAATCIKVVMTAAEKFTWIWPSPFG